jgi:histidinol phosphatase-like PHP family hydrolase
MPTVLRKKGFRFVINTDDHEPPHVHVFKAGEQVAIDLKVIRVRRVRGMSKTNVGKAVEIVEDHQSFLLSEWRRFHS